MTGHSLRPSVRPPPPSVPPSIFPGIHPFTHTTHTPIHIHPFGAVRFQLESFWEHSTSRSQCPSTNRPFSAMSRMAHQRWRMFIQRIGLVTSICKITAATYKWIRKLILLTGQSSEQWRQMSIIVFQIIDNLVLFCSLFNKAQHY